MNIKIKREEIEKIMANPEEATKSGIKIADPWWVIALKVAAYLIGLILAGVGTVSAQNIFF